MDSGLFLTGVELLDTRGGSVPPVIPAAPTVLAVTNSAATVTLTWTENDTYSLVTIDRATGSGNFLALTTLSGGVATYDDATVSVGTTYSYKVRGLTGGYPSPYSNTVSATVTAVSFAAKNPAATGNWLAGGNPSGLQVTSNDSFIIGGWITTGALLTNASLFAKGDITVGTGSTDFSYSLDVPSGGGIKFSVATDTNAINNTSVPPLRNLLPSTTYFILAWTDLGANTLNLQLNNGVVDSVDLNIATTTDSGQNVSMFAENDGSRGFDSGVMDEVFFCKNPADMTIAINTIQTNIYNSGTGLKYADVLNADKTTIGLISWWTLDQASGASRTDAKGSNNLTLHGTITQVSPIVS